MQIPFYANNHTRKYISAFMDFFGNISVEKITTQVTSAGNTQVFHKFIRVPVQWCSTEKWLAVLNSRTARKGFEPDRLDRIPVEIEYALPRIGVSMVGMSYAPERHIGKANRITEYVVSGNWINEQAKNIFAPSPWNLMMEVSIATKNINELFQIIEQIIPFFTPSLSFNVILFDDKPSESVPVVLTDVNPEIEDEITESDERIFKAMLNFTMKVNYYLPKRLDRVIEQINMNLGVNMSVSGDPSFYKFDQYVQRATLDHPIGEYEEIVSFSENPVTTDRYVLTNQGAYDPAYPYTIGDAIMYNGTTLRYVGGYDSPAVSGQASWEI